VKVRPIVEFTLYALLARQTGILNPPMRLAFHQRAGLYWSA
jgi:hypothetical protein